MIEKIGMVVVLIGLMAADSPSILAPLGIIAAGVLIVVTGRRVER